MTRYSLRAANGREDWGTVAEWTCPAFERYYAVAAKDRRLFVTYTGRVFLAPDQPHGELKQVWDGPPVRALIRDEATDVTYAFTADQVFAVGPDIKPRPHGLAEVTGRGPDHGLDELVRCARVVARLADPPKK